MRKAAVLRDDLHIALHDRQLEVFRSKARFRVLVAGRRFGKTYLALSEMVHAAQTPGRVIWYVGPSDHQSKRVAWDRLKAMTRKFWAKRPSETKLRIDLVFGSSIMVAGAFNADSLRGDGLDLLVLDEFASLPPQAWAEVFRPALADRKGRALFIGTPKGRNHFYDHFEFAKTDPDWEAFQFTTAQGGLVDAAELSGAARQLDAESFRQEFEAEFTAIGCQRAYYAFDRATHVTVQRFDKLRPLIWSLDFNVNPMCMLLMQRQGDVVNVLEEIVVRPEASTEAACRAFQERAIQLYAQVPPHQRPFEIEIYGDASGNQRRTSGAATDWAIVRQFFALWKGTYQPNFRIVSANPAVRDRVNCVNSRLRNQLNEVRLFIDPGCRELIRDLEQVSWGVEANGAGTTELDKSDRARTHASDALGYYISQAFSMRATIGEKAGRIV